MEVAQVDEAIELLEKANANLQPELLSVPAARQLLEAYALAQRLAAFGVATLAGRLDDVSELARATGTSVGKAKDTIATGKVLGDSDELRDALRHGDDSLDQATEIAAAERSAPGAARELLPVARDEPFHVLKDEARKVKLEAEQHKDLAERQRAARSARSSSDELGMVHVHLAFEPPADRAQFDLWQLEEGRSYDELATHVAEEQRRREAGEPELGHPDCATLIKSETVEAQGEGTLAVDVGAGTYRMACFRFGPPGTRGGIFAAGPFEV